MPEDWIAHMGQLTHSVFLGLIDCFSKNEKRMSDWKAIIFFWNYITLVYVKVYIQTEIVQFFIRSYQS